MTKISTAAATKPTNPAVGQLTRKGKPVFYAYVRGQYLEGSIEVLEAKLERA